MNFKDLEHPAPPGPKAEQQAWRNDPAYDQVHEKRFALSLEALRPYLTKSTRVLCLGEPGSFEMGHVLPLVGLLTSQISDLRYSFSTPGIAQTDNDRDFDVILCMEVLEHIHDQDAQKPTEWRSTGTDNLLRESFRLLKPGGIFFLTTPNACSLNVLEKVLTMQAPMVYRPHVREYAPAEVDAMLKGHGFQIVSFETHDCWGGGMGNFRRAVLQKVMHEGICASPHRGEDIFVIARKPN